MSQIRKNLLSPVKTCELAADFQNANFYIPLAM